MTWILLIALFATAMLFAGKHMDKKREEHNEASAQ
jgi:hypothetical protein